MQMQKQEEVILLKDVKCFQKETKIESTNNDFLTFQMTACENI